MAGTKKTHGQECAQNGSSAFSKAAVQPNPAFAQWNSTKRPLMTSPYRPTAAIRWLRKAAIRTTAVPWNLPDCQITRLCQSGRTTIGRWVADL